MVNEKGVQCNLLIPNRRFETCQDQVLRIHFSYLLAFEDLSLNTPRKIPNSNTEVVVLLRTLTLCTLLYIAYSATVVLHETSEST